MYREQSNPAAVRSQNLIAEAIFELMSEKEYNEITVTEVCCRAGVGRKTFYRNFELKEDIILFRIDSLYNEYCAENRGSEGVEEHLFSFYSFFQRHIKSVKALYDNNLIPLLERKFSEYLPKVMPRWSTDPIEQDYISRFVVSGLISLLTVWAKHGFSEDIDKLVEITYKALNRTASRADKTP